MALLANAHANTFDGGTYRSAAQRWEYQEMALPLELGTMRSWFGAERLMHRVAQRADAAIQRHIERLGAQGWRPDEPISFLSLYRRNRVQASYRGGVVPGHEVREVSIRFKRPTS